MIMIVNHKDCKHFFDIEQADNYFLIYYLNSFGYKKFTPTLAENQSLDIN
ncbi:hypothetical protein ROD_48091 [Citrobacter rodentium ICC168]|uniref:Uncharacterized protein n=1 Tax=Citrobacter rodentium (strain ICC168) TaxID=637910 RepID=D2TR20_CITRI|nr:hypothetical protein ROD_48091 [Citrobacter rodentium ICC168]